MVSHRLKAMLMAFVATALWLNAFIPASAQSPALELGIVAPGVAEPGGLAPDFVLWDMEKEPVQLSDFRGTPVVLNFFASWCGPCLIELPFLQAAHLEAEDKGYVVLGVVFKDSRGAVRELAAAENLTFAMVIDGDDSVGLAYHVLGPPYTFFIDRDGIIIEVISGPLEKETLDASLARLLE